MEEHPLPAYHHWIFRRLPDFGRFVALRLVSPERVKRGDASLPLSHPVTRDLALVGRLGREGVNTFPSGVERKVRGDRPPSTRAVKVALDLVHNADDEESAAPPACSNRVQQWTSER